MAQISLFGSSGDTRFEVSSREEGLKNIQEQLDALSRAQKQSAHGFERAPVRDDTPWNLLQNYIDYYLRFRGMKPENSRDYAERIVGLIRSRDTSELRKELELLVNGSKGRPEDEELVEVLHEGVKRLYNT